MRERLTTLACALGALLLFVTLFVRGAGDGRLEVALPTSVERGDNGLAGAMSWLAQEHVRSLSLRERFGGLRRRHDLTPGGNLLIVSLPVATPFGPDELRSLDQWVRAGNTLLVLAAIADKPGWAAGRVFHGDLNDLTGMGYEAVRTLPGAAGAPTGGTGPDLPAVVAAAEAAYQPLARPQRTTLVPNRPHPYLDGVRQAMAWSDYPWRLFPWDAWSVTVPRQGFLLCLAHQGETGEGVLWVRPRAAGTLIVSGFGSLFSNRALTSADNARLLANIVGASLGPGGAVLFDDEHQGISDAYDAAKFYRDSRLYATLGVLAAVWLVWVLGGTRLRVPQTHAPAPREAELVRATGEFLARVLAPAAAARRMLEHFVRRVRARTRRAPGSQVPPWELLE
ncbi:MAG: DUF4350 domain-containing protein, partial [Steroidobacteraceae bacterium]